MSEPPSDANNLPDNLFLFDRRNLSIVQGKTSFRASTPIRSWIVSVVIVLILGGCSFAVALSGASQETPVLSEGVMGQVTEVYTQEEQLKSGTVTHYFINVRYTYEGGEWHRGIEIDGGTYRRFRVNQSIALNLDPTHPDRVALLGTNPYADDISTMRILTVVIGVITIVVVVLVIVQPYLQARSWRKGKVLFGTIDSIEPYKVRFKQMLHVVFTFTNPAGQSITAAHDVLQNDLSQLQLPTKGMPVALWYANARQRRLL